LAASFSESVFGTEAASVGASPATGVATGA